MLRFKYTTKFSLPKIACPAIVYAEIVVVTDPFFVVVCPRIKVYRYNPTEICQQRLQGVRNVAQKLCSWERSFSRTLFSERESEFFQIVIVKSAICGASSEFVSSSIPSWQILTAHAQPFRGTRDLAFCLKVPLDLLLVWASSGGSGKTARMRRLAWTFAARLGDKYQISLTRPNYAN